MVWVVPPVPHLRKLRLSVSEQQGGGLVPGLRLSPVTLGPSRQEAASGSNTWKGSGSYKVVHAGREPSVVAGQW